MPRLTSSALTCNPCQPFSPPPFHWLRQHNCWVDIAALTLGQSDLHVSLSDPFLAQASSNYLSSTSSLDLHSPTWNCGLDSPHHSLFFESHPTSFFEHHRDTERIVMRKFRYACTLQKLKTTSSCKSGGSGDAVGLHRSLRHRWSARRHARIRT